MHYTVFVGRFQPPHPGHIHVIREALRQSDRLIIVLGSTNGARSLKNPFSAPERKALILSMLEQHEWDRIDFTNVPDTLYDNNAWIKNVQRSVRQVIGRRISETGSPEKISLIGHSKDQSSFYLKMFPEWNSIEVDNYNGFSSTPIRNWIYVNGAEKIEWAPKLLGQLTEETDWFDDLCDEYHWVQQYKKEWGDGQWNTVDAVVTIGGHILLIERGGRPGLGQWALPGGFLNKNERIVDAVVRELREETKLKVPEPVLLGSIDAHDVFDALDRDPRGRIISHAYHFNMWSYGASPGDKLHLPKVQGSDDAKKARWFTLQQFEEMRPNIFADHYDIAMNLIGRAERKW